MDNMQQGMPPAAQTPSPAPMDKDVQDNKLMAAISYISVLCLVGLFGKKDSPYVQYHAKQGFVLFVAEIILMFVWVIPILGWLVGFFGWILTLVLAIMGIMNALNGKKTELPVLGGFAKNVNF